MTTTTGPGISSGRRATVAFDAFAAAFEAPLGGAAEAVAAVYEDAGVGSQ